MLWEVFVTRFEEAFEQYEQHRLAGELLGMSGRTFPPAVRSLRGGRELGNKLCYKVTKLSLQAAGLASVSQSAKVSRSLLQPPVLAYSMREEN
jgi:hypothetical protein